MQRVNGLQLLAFPQSIELHAAAQVPDTLHGRQKMLARPYTLHRVKHGRCLADASQHPACPSRRVIARKRINPQWDGKEGEPFRVGLLDDLGTAPILYLLPELSVGRADFVFGQQELVFRQMPRHRTASHEEH